MRYTERRDMDTYAFRIDTDEDGFFLEVTGTDRRDAVVYEERIPIADPEAFYDHVKAAIGPWLYERDMARQGRMHEAADAREAYDATDYKHPEWYSIHADIHDAREGK
jgi:hypothetical protein